MRSRTHSFHRDVIAGCEVCGGGKPMWTGGNAQGVAARHFDATGHETWVEVGMHITYHAPRAKQVETAAVVTAGAYSLSTYSSAGR
jgi:hypothetical protein